MMKSRCKKNASRTVFMPKKILSLILTSALCLTSAPGDTAAAESENTAGFQTATAAGSENTAIALFAIPNLAALAKTTAQLAEYGITVKSLKDFGKTGPADQSAGSSAGTLYSLTVSSKIHSPDKLVKTLSGMAYAVTAEPDCTRQTLSLTDDTYSDMQWYLNASSRFPVSSEGIRFSKSGASGTDAPVVAVIDSGVDYTHEDLADRMWANPTSTIPGACGYDFINADTDPMDDNGHGTHCAGLIGAACDNQTGIAGVAENVRIMALKVFDKNGEGSTTTIVDALNYIYKAKKNGVNIVAVNCSWGGGISSSIISSLLDKLGGEGMLFVFAAGNDGINKDRQESSEKECPYDIDSPYIIKVGASNWNDNAASFSNYGLKSVDIFAPGTSILSTVSRNIFLPAIYSDEKKNALSAFYSSGADGSTPLFYTPPQIGLPPQDIKYGEIRHESNDFMADDSSGSIYIPMTAASSDMASASVYIDTEGLPLIPSASHVISFEYALDMTDNSSKNDPSWTHGQRNLKASDFIKEGQKTYLRLFSLSGSFNTCQGVYIDEIAISAADTAASNYGKYNFMTGTSMAAPLISGAVAVLAGKFPEDSVSQRRQRLLSCVHRTPDISTKCVSGGILDMSLFDSSEAAEPENSDSKIPVKKVALNIRKKKLKYGKKFKLKASVAPSDATNKKIRWRVSKPAYIKVSKNGVVHAKKKGIGHSAKVFACAKDGSGRQAACLVRITHG